MNGERTHRHDQISPCQQRNARLAHLAVGAFDAAEDGVDLVVKVAQHVGCRDVLRLAGLVAVDRLVGVDHEPRRGLDGARAHVDAVVAGGEADLLVGVADLGTVSVVPHMWSCDRVGVVWGGLVVR